MPMATLPVMTNSETRRWEVALDNGLYMVSVVAGSPRTFGEHRVVLQGALVVVKDGAIVAMVGGFDNRFFNRAIQAKRLMGSVSMAHTSRNRAPTVSMNRSVTLPL